MRRLNKANLSEQGVNNIEAQGMESEEKFEENIKLPVDIVKKFLLHGTYF